MGKEVKLFNLSDFLVGRYAKLSDEFYDANKRLAIKRNVISTVFVTIGTLGYYGAYAVTIYLTVLGRFSIGALTFLAGSFRQSRDLIQPILLSLSHVVDQSRCRSRSGGASSSRTSGSGIRARIAGRCVT